MTLQWTIDIHSSRQANHKEVLQRRKVMITLYHNSPQDILHSKLLLHKGRPKDSKIPTIRSRLHLRTNSPLQILTHSHRHRQVTATHRNSLVTLLLRRPERQPVLRQHKDIFLTDRQGRLRVHLPLEGTKDSTARNGLG
jgi:hypothetical protein